MRPELRIITLASLLIPAGIAHAQFSALELVNETDERLILDPTFEYLNLEKDITWGDFDNDGDVDVAVAIKFVGSIEGGWPNLLLMNENGVLTDRTDQFATDSDLAWRRWIRRALQRPQRRSHGREQRRLPRPGHGHHDE